MPLSFWGKSSFIVIIPQKTSHFICVSAKGILAIYQLLL
jgi:hypothetical protein